MIPGMSWGSHKWIFMAWMYTAAGFTATWKVMKAAKQQKEDEFVDFYRYSGSYKHPWEDPNTRLNDVARGLEAIKGKDYIQLINS